RVYHRAHLIQGVRAFSTLHFPDEDLSAVSAPTPAGQPRPFGTPGHAHDYASMPSQLLEQCAVGSLPQAHAAIIATTGQAHAIRTPAPPPNPARRLRPPTHPPVP